MSRTLLLTLGLLVCLPGCPTDSDDDDTAPGDDDDTAPGDDDDTASGDDDDSAPVDADDDGVLAGDDCDDEDAALGAIAADADCDGALTADDCNDEDEEVLAADCSGRWPAPTNTLLLSVPDPSTGLYLNDVQASYPDVDWSTLERLYIPRGQYSYIHIGNLPARDPATPLVITNYGGQVWVGDLGHYYNFVIGGGSGWVVTGRYDPDAETGHADYPGHRGNRYASTQGTYGFLIDDASDDRALSGLSVGGGATRFELEFIEVRNVGFAGIVLKTDNDGDATMSDCQLHDLYIHDTDSEGLYIGSTQPQPQHRIEGLNFYNNRVIRTGTELLQAGQLGLGNEIHHNVFALGALTWKAPFQQWQDNGLQIGVREGSSSIHHNVIIGAADSLLLFMSQPADTDSPQPSDLVHIHDNYFSHGRARGSYVGWFTTSVSTLRFEDNTYRAMTFERDEVYDTTNGDVVFAMGAILDTTIEFIDVTWEGLTNLHNQGTDPNGAYGSVSGSGNVYGSTDPYPFVDLGLDPAMDFLRVEYWTAQATVGRQEPVIYHAGDIAIIDGVLYEALSENSGVYPPTDASVWSALSAPVDDVRVARGSAYEGIGLLDTRP